MPIQTGSQVQFGFGKEAPKGTASSPTYWPTTLDRGLNPKTARAKDDSARGRIEGIAESKVVEKWSEPNAGGYIFDQSSPLLLLAALGSVVTTADSPEIGVNTHNFTVQNDNDHPSLTVVSKDGNMTKAAPYAMLDSLELDVVKGEFAKYSASFIAKSIVTVSETPANIAENIFVPRHAEVKIAADLAGLGAAPAVSVLSAKVQIGKSAQAHYALGTDEPSVITNGRLIVSGTLELRFEDTTYLDYALNGTKKAVRITLANTDIIIGAANNPTIEIDLAQVAFDFDRSEGSEEIITQTVDFEAEYSQSDAKMITAKVLNTVASY